MGALLAVNVAVLDEAGLPVILEAGSEVPSWASDQVGEHCLVEETGPKTARKPRGTK